MEDTLILIKCDVNDADYISRYVHLESSDPNDAETINLVQKIIKTLIENKKDRYYHNWPRADWGDTIIKDLYGGLLTEDEIEHFNNTILPTIHNDSEDVHTIIEILVYNITKPPLQFKR